MANVRPCGRHDFGFSKIRAPKAVGPQTFVCQMLREGVPLRLGRVEEAQVRKDNCLDVRVLKADVPFFEVVAGETPELFNRVNELISPVQTCGGNAC